MSEGDRDPDVYRVVYGWGSYLDFDTFEEARVFWAMTRGANIFNMAHYDGAPDGSDGLTRAERDLLEGL